MLSFSVSTSHRGSSILTTSPTFFFHLRMAPSSIVGLSAIMKTFSAMVSAPVEGPLGGGDDFGDSGLHFQFEGVVVGHRDVFARHELHGGVQVVEALLHDLGLDP